MDNLNLYEKIKVQGIEYEAKMISCYDFPLEFYVEKEQIYLRFFEEVKNEKSTSHLFICIRGHNLDDLYKLNEEELKKINHCIVTNQSHVNVFNLYLTLPNFPTN